MNSKVFEDCIIFETLTGSQIYGTSTPLSDTDYRGVVIPPWDVREGMLQNFEQKDGWGEKEYQTWPKERLEDRTIYSLKKFLQLCLKANPSILELLFIPQEFWVRPKDPRPVDPWMQILENREHFLSSKAKFTFSGYAHSQLERIKRHRAYLLNPPKEEPTREKYGLPANPALSQEQLSALLTIPEGFVLEHYRDQARNEKAYRDTRTQWNMYMDWKNSRNAKRAELEAKYGYDTKHAAHLVRLVHEGEELLTTGKITLPRPEVDLLRDILEGRFKYDELMERFEGFDEKFDALYETSVLPHSPNTKTANELYLGLISDAKRRPV